MIGSALILQEPLSGRKAWAGETKSPRVGGKGETDESQENHSRKGRRETSSGACRKALQCLRRRITAGRAFCSARSETDCAVVLESPDSGRDQRVQ